MTTSKKIHQERTVFLAQGRRTGERYHAGGFRKAELAADHEQSPRSVEHGSMLGGIIRSLQPQTNDLIESQ
ncbi:hypothetical protein [Lacipirellula sp.]|uniref:hypothetical protein n=1 Tax=Lacipirellula sp. TaxID=2691419 RepID=UPI003D0EE62F